MRGFIKTLTEIPVIIAALVALILGGVLAVIAGILAGAAGCLVAALALRGVGVLMKKLVKPDAPENRRRVIAMIVAVPFLVLIIAVPMVALRLAAPLLVPAIISGNGYAFSILLGVFVALVSVKHI